MTTHLMILADKSAGGETPAGGWPATGIQFIDAAHQPVDPPEEWELSTRWVATYAGAPWLHAENARQVVRPSQPDPARTEDGTIVPSSEHQFAAVPPHTLVHIDALTFDTPAGPVRYVVTHQPDKYLDSDDGSLDDEQVTIEAYAAGHTRVDHFYRLTLDQNQKG